MATDSPRSEHGPRDASEHTRFVRERSPPALESTLVCSGDGPDRRTVYPPELTSVARLSTWLTADEEAFRSLSEMR